MSLPPNKKKLVIEAATNYIDRGWKITKARLNSKDTYERGWQKDDYCAAPEECGRAGGVAIKTGAASGNLVIVDPDTPEARKAGERFLPKTLRSGHSGTFTHSYYYVPDLAALPGLLGTNRTSHQFKDADGTVIVEILADKRRAIAPPTLYSEGNPRVWELDREPATITAAELLEAVRRVATVGLLARHVPDSGRHDWSLAVAAHLLREDYRRG